MATGHNLRVIGVADRWLGVLALLGLFALSLPGCEQKGEPAASDLASRPKIGILPEGASKPDIIVILVDALRPDRLGAYGHAGGLSPTIDALSTAGVTFDFCVAPAPWTLPSVATLFTSYYPGVHKATSYRVVAGMESGKQAQQSVLSDEFDTLAEVLQHNGYQTAGFCAAAFLRAEYGFGQGFEHFDTSFAANTVRGEVLNAALFKWLGESRDPAKPLFLYLHYMDVHGPYDAAPRFMDPLMETVEAGEKKQLLSADQLRTLLPYLNKPPAVTSDPQRFDRLKGYREYWVARYDAGVAEADFYLAQLVEHLRELAIWNDAYVIFLADHGEALCEHGLWGHGYSQYQTDLHVPLILRWPNVLPAGKRVRRLASLIDLMPTLLEQLRLPPGENLQGKSLVDHVSDRVPNTPPLMRFAEGRKSGPKQYALFTERTKLIVTSLPRQNLPDGTLSKPEVRHVLFNLGADPGERFNIAGEHPQVVAQLKELMRRVVWNNMNTKPELVVQQKAVDEETIRRLESLGYMGAIEEEDEAEEEAQPASQPATQPEGDAIGDSGEELGEPDGRP